MSRIKSRNEWKTGGVSLETGAGIRAGGIVGTSADRRAGTSRIEPKNMIRMRVGTSVESRVQDRK